MPCVRRRFYQETIWERHHSWEISGGSLIIEQELVKLRFIHAAIEGERCTSTRMIKLTACVFECGKNIFFFEIRQHLNNFVTGKPFSHQIKDINNPDTQPSNAWPTSTLIRICGDSCFPITFEVVVDWCCVHLSTNTNHNVDCFQLTRCFHIQKHRIYTPAYFDKRNFFFILTREARVKSWEFSPRVIKIFLLSTSYDIRCFRQNWCPGLRDYKFLIHQRVELFMWFMSNQWKNNTDLYPSF